MIDKDTEPWQLEGSFSLKDLKSDQRGGPPRQNNLFPSLNTGQSDSAYIYIFEWTLFFLALEKGEIFSRIPRRKLSVTKLHKTRMKLNYDQPLSVPRSEELLSLGPILCRCEPTSTGLKIQSWALFFLPRWRRAWRPLKAPNKRIAITTPHFAIRPRIKIVSTLSSLGLHIFPTGHP